VINIASLARDAAAARTTVEGYLGILQDTLVATLLPAFEAQLRVRERQHPKLYWVDPGLARAAKRHLGPVAAEERGPLLEGLVLTILRRSLMQIGVGAMIGLPVAFRFVNELAEDGEGKTSTLSAGLLAVGVAAGIVMVVGLCACLVPARRVLAIEATQAMKGET
jgi:hypothetical protein